MNWYGDESRVFGGVSMTSREYAKQHGLTSGGLADAHQFYMQYVTVLPLHIILPTTIQVQRLISLFGTDSEILLVRIIEAVTDRCNADVKIANVANEFYKALGQHRHDHGTKYLDHMIAVEQAGLDIRDMLKNNGLYVQDRWMPYAYETTVDHSAIMLKRPESFEEFCDNFLWASGIDEYLQSRYE